jgi:hypothetical protein
MPTALSIFAPTTCGRFHVRHEASHGTHEFSAWRPDHPAANRGEGFSFVAVEGDWPDCDRVHRAAAWLTHRRLPRILLLAFERWPTWMWANEEVVDFTSCLDWTLIWNRRHLEHVLRQYLEHYNTGRPHRGINLEVPMPARVSTVTPPTTGCVVERVDVLGGLIHE